MNHKKYSEKPIMSEMWYEGELEGLVQIVEFLEEGAIILNESGWLRRINTVNCLKLHKEKPNEQNRK